MPTRLTEHGWADLRPTTGHDPARPSSRTTSCRHDGKPRASDRSPVGGRATWTAGLLARGSSAGFRAPSQGPMASVANLRGGFASYSCGHSPGILRAFRFAPSPGSLFSPHEGSTARAEINHLHRRFARDFAGSVLAQKNRPGKFPAGSVRSMADEFRSGCDPSRRRCAACSDRCCRCRSAP